MEWHACLAVELWIFELSGVRKLDVGKFMRIDTVSIPLRLGD